MEVQRKRPREKWGRSWRIRRRKRNREKGCKIRGKKRQLGAHLGSRRDKEKHVRVELEERKEKETGCSKAPGDPEEHRTGDARSELGLVRGEETDPQTGELKSLQEGDGPNQNPAELGGLAGQERVPPSDNDLDRQKHRDTEPDAPGDQAGEKLSGVSLRILKEREKENPTAPEVEESQEDELQRRTEPEISQDQGRTSREVDTLQEEEEKEKQREETGNPKEKGMDGRIGVELENLKDKDAEKHTVIRLEILKGQENDEQREAELEFLLMDQKTEKEHRGKRGNLKDREEEEKQRPVELELQKDQEEVSQGEKLKNYESEKKGDEIGIPKERDEEKETLMGEEPEILRKIQLNENRAEEPESKILIN